MSADATEQLRDLAGWIDELWSPQDPAGLRGDAHPAPPDPPRVPSGRIVAIAACLALAVGLAAVLVRARDTGGSLVVDQPVAPGTVEIDGWHVTPELAFTDGSLAIQAPAVWTGRELLLVGALVEPLAAEAQDLPSEGQQVRETPAYDPATDSWRTYPEPPVRMSGVVDAVWTGSEVLVVSSGGFSVGPATVGSTPAVSPCTGTTGEVITVASLDPISGTWTLRPEPAVEAGPVSDLVWDGNRAWLVFGDACVVGYDPATDTYADPIAPDPSVLRSATAASPAPPLVSSAVLAGTELLLGFADGSGPVGVDLASRTARDIDAPTFPSADLVTTDAGVVQVSTSSGRAAVFDSEAGGWRDLPDSPLGPRSAWSPPSWTGQRVVVWGGSAIPAGRADPTAEPDWRTDGALLDPLSGTWAAIPAAPVDAPFARSAWAGDRLVVWWGGNALGDRHGVLRGMTWQPSDTAVIVDGPVPAPADPGTIPPAVPDGERTAGELQALDERAARYGVDTDGDGLRCEGSDPAFDPLLGRRLDDARSAASDAGYHLQVWGGPDASGFETLPMLNDRSRLLVCVDADGVVESVVNG